MTSRLLAILVVDLCGFSADMAADEHAALDRKDAMQRLVHAEAMAAGGFWVKAWADDNVAVFPTVAQAQACAAVLVARERCSIGIGWGALILDRPPGDVWGVEMNLACKLGEDVAREGQVLLTDAARAASESMRVGVSHES